MAYRVLLSLKIEDREAVAVEIFAAKTILAATPIPQPVEFVEEGNFDVIVGKLWFHFLFLAQMDQHHLEGIVEWSRWASSAVGRTTNNITVFLLNIRVFLLEVMKCRGWSKKLLLLLCNRWERGWIGSRSVGVAKVAVRCGRHASFVFIV